MQNMPSSLSSEELFNQLRAALIGRLHDRESAVRSQAVIALAHLSVLEDPDDHDGERSILEVLLDTMSGDSSACVPASLDSPPSCLNSLLVKYGVAPY